MKLNLDSVKKICGDSREVVIYGLTRAKYDQVFYALYDLNSPMFKAYCHNYYPYQHILDANGRYTESEICKDVISSLILENVKREKNGEPFVILLFCVEFDIQDTKEFTLDEKRVATSNKADATRGITDQELRRCYKLCCDADDQQINATARQSIKFVKVKQDSVFNPEFCSIQEIRPFWESNTWDALWDIRKFKRSIFASATPDSWLKALKSEIDKIQMPSTNLILHV